MRFPLLTMLAALLLGGCPAPIAPDQSPVNDRMRAACWYMDDQEIEGQLIGLAAVRDSGTTKADCVEGYMAGCFWGAEEVSGSEFEALERASDCWTCGAVLIDEVYENP